MSVSACLHGFQEFLKANIDTETPEQEVRVRVGGDGSPGLPSGQLSYVVFPMSWTPGPSADQHMGLDEIYGIGVAISARIGWMPRDRRTMAGYLDFQDTRGIIRHGLEHRAREVMLICHGRRYDLMCVINSFMDGEDKLTEPFRWQSTDPWPITVGPEWFRADPMNPDNDRDFGWVMNVRFAEGRRLQAQENMR